MADKGPAGRKAGSLERVTSFLERHGLAGALIEFDDGSTKTSQMAADAVGCELGQIVKTLVFLADDEPVLALVAGDRRGDPEAIGALLGAHGVRFADADTVRQATGYAIGGVSPYDLPGELTVLIDDSFSRFDELFTAGGTPQTMVRLSRDTFERIVPGRVARVSR